jgi:protein MBA1
LESEQQLSMTPVSSPSTSHKTRAPKWAPAHAQKTEVVSPVEQSAEVQDKGKVQTVVEYLVMQTRVMDGKEEDWKIWGFTSESTPAKIEEDEQYWKKMLDIQSANA